MRKADLDAVVALDDDPTGVQLLERVPVLLAWDAERVAEALTGRRTVHLLTNARALPPEAVGAVVHSAASAAVTGAPHAHVVMRGDSTLRGHVREELIALRQIVDPEGVAPVLLVPALPSAGRVTVGGIHLIDRDGTRTRLDETEYARDGVFSYSSSRLLTWAEERTGGLLAAAAGRELGLDDLRRDGAERVATVIGELRAIGAPAAFAPDAETLHDLELIAEGYRLACSRGAKALVRCAPAFAGVLSGTIAHTLVEPPFAEDGVLVVCGSYVSRTSRQLERLLAAHPGSLVEVDAAALASAAPRPEIERATAAVSRLLDRERLAVLSTPRQRSPELATLEAGERIARGMAAVVAARDPAPPVIVAKGGITSHVTLQRGLGADAAEVLGPVLPGVSRWRVESSAGVVDYVVVPGNVGDDDLLVNIVALVMGG